MIIVYVLFGFTQIKKGDMANFGLEVGNVNRENRKPILITLNIYMAIK